MKSSWLIGLDKEDERNVRSNFKEALLLRRRLKKILEERIEESRKSSMLKSSYDNPNWAYLQADARGYERALNEIIGLIE